MSSKVLMIVGMHRSGTSLITKWLYDCGLFVGDDLEEANEGNREGHFEDKDFLSLHRKFLKNRNCPDTGFVDQKLSLLQPVEINELESLIEKRNSQHKQWGWKEPRTVLFLGTYQKLIPSANYLFIARSYCDIVSSMIMREYKINVNKINSKKGLSKLKWQLFKKKTLEGLSKKYAEPYLKTWILYSEEILRHARSLAPEQFCFVKYSMLSQEDEFIFNKLISGWNFSLNYIPFSSVFKKELLSDVINIEDYVKDKSLIAKAKEIESSLENYIATSQLIN